MMTKNKATRMLAEAGIMIALALVLGMIKPYEFPTEARSLWRCSPCSCSVCVGAWPLAW